VRRRVTATLGDFRWRPLTDSAADTDFVLALRNDPRFARWFYHQQVTPQTHANFIRAADERGEINWIVERAGDTEQRVGVASIYNIDRANRKAECGRTIFVEPKAFYLNWVVSAVTGMELLGVDKLYIETMADNRIIARGVERMGMTCQARLRGHVVRDGRPLDVLLYTMLADQWRAIRATTFEKWGTPQIVEAITA
jgi:RimJ/RimL family protein N-acetyltransferase